MGLLGLCRFSAPPAIQPPLKHRINPANAEVLKSTTRETSCFVLNSPSWWDMPIFLQGTTGKKNKRTNTQTNKIKKKTKKVQNSDVDHADQLLSIGFKFLSIDLKVFVSFFPQSKTFLALSTMWQHTRQLSLVEIEKTNRRKQEATYLWKKLCTRWDYHINWCRISSINSSTQKFVLKEWT